MNQTTTTVRRGRQVETATVTLINPTYSPEGFILVAVKEIKRFYDGEITEVIHWGLTESAQHIHLNQRSHDTLCLWTFQDGLKR